MDEERPQVPVRLRSLPVDRIPTREGVLLRRGTTLFRINGDRADEVVGRILAAMDGPGATVDEVVGSFEAQEQESVRWLVGELRGRRVLLPSDARDFEGPLGPTRLFYWHFGTPEASSPEASDRPIALIGRNRTSRHLQALLAEAGTANFVLVSDPELDGPDPEDAEVQTAAGALESDEWRRRGGMDAAALVVCITDFGGLGSMRPWNDLCVRSGKPFLPVVLQDMVATVGPLVVPGSTGCFECFLSRRYSNLDDHPSRRAAEERPDIEGIYTGFHPAMSSIAADLAAIEMTKFLLPWRELWQVGDVITANLLATEINRHHVLKVPRCSVCSEAGAVQPTSIYSGRPGPVDEIG